MKYPLYAMLTYILLSMLSVQAQNDSLDSPVTETDSLSLDPIINDLEGEELFLTEFSKTVYLFRIHDEIGPGATRITQNAVKIAEEKEVDYLVLDLNTYGGLVTDADSIRTALLHCKIPTIVFIRNNAASAGALISIACDSIYMNTGSTIGAAAVVNADGSYAEEKYQSYMRKKMRSTAEGTNRNPDIAEGMVNPKVEIEGVTKDDEIITFTVDEAIANGYCNGKAETLEDVYEAIGLEDPTIITHEVSFAEKMIQVLIKPAVSGVLLMILIGGIYFELKTPGVGFPLAAAGIAAILYFAPLYLEGFAAYWEIILFGVGVVLLLVELFVLPGFGIAGFAGISAIIFSLAFALLKNIDGFDFSFVPANDIGSAFLMVSSIMVFGVIALLFASKNLAKTKAFQRLALNTTQEKTEGYVISASLDEKLDGKIGVVTMDLRPAGKIEIDDVQYDAQSNGEYLAEGTRVLVKKRSGAYLIVNEVRS